MSPASDAGRRVSANVRAEMARRRVTRQELAKRLEVSRRALGRRLDDEVAFDADEVAAIAAVLEVPESTLWA